MMMGTARSWRANFALMWAVALCGIAILYALDLAGPLAVALYRGDDTSHYAFADGVIGFLLYLFLSLPGWKVWLCARSPVKAENPLIAND